jgi:hypothetical protein
MERWNPLYYNLQSKNDIDIIEIKAKKLPLSKTYTQPKLLLPYENFVVHFLFG